MKQESQNQRILDHLKSGRSLTAYDAHVKFDCLRLASRINDLKNQGHDIETEMKEISNGKRIARYSYGSFLNKKPEFN